MARQVISISADGGVSGLQVKPGKGLDLRKLGRAEIHRASEIIFDDIEQMWFVKITRGLYEGRILTDIMWGLAGIKHHPNNVRGLGHKGRFLFDEYDDAVAAEIAFLDHVRLTKGAAALE